MASPAGSPVRRFGTGRGSERRQTVPPSSAVNDLRVQDRLRPGRHHRGRSPRPQGWRRRRRRGPEARFGAQQGQPAKLPASRGGLGRQGNACQADLVRVALAGKAARVDTCSLRAAVAAPRRFGTGAHATAATQRASNGHGGPQRALAPRFGGWRGRAVGPPGPDDRHSPPAGQARCFGSAMAPVKADRVTGRSCSDDQPSRKASASRARSSGAAEVGHLARLTG